MNTKKLLMLVCIFFGCESYLVAGKYKPVDGRFDEYEKGNSGFLSGKKNSYVRIGQRDFDKLKADNQELKDSVNRTCQEIKEKSRSVDDMHFVINLYRVSAQEHHIKALRRQKSEGSLSFKEKRKNKKIEKQSRKIEKRVAKLLALSVHDNY